VPLTQMDIRTILVGDGPVSSVIVLRPRDEEEGEDAPRLQLPIKVGRFEASAIGVVVNGTPHNRPLTHDLLGNVIRALDATIVDVTITDLVGTTYFSRVRLRKADGEVVDVDARPSDALALAIRENVPIYADEKVLEAANPKVAEARAQSEQLALFHDFLEGVSPDDFAAQAE